jgi:2-polyprenyl-3-methyl-5-hydroxy-6-metoxy-1,4-benzoquinol methylase
MLENCPICHGNSFGRWRFHGLRECGSCGHVFEADRNRRVSARALQLTHFSDAFVARHVGGMDAFYDLLTTSRRVRQLKPLTDASCRALEVGVGRGRVLGALKKLGWRVEGIDLSPEVCRAIAQRLGVVVHCQTLEDFAQNTPHHKWDVIIMCHVLEHFEDPVTALRSANALLRQGGMLYIAVPNVAAPDARLPGWTGYAPYHLHYFSSGSLTRLLSDTGFVIARKSTFEPLSGWCNAGARTLFGNCRSFATARPGGNRPQPLTRLIYDAARLGTGTLISPLRWVQAALGYGEELVVIGRSYPA